MFHSSRFHRALLPLALSVLLLFSSGCGIFSPDESKEAPPPVSGDFEPATSPEILMENFKKAWEQMSIVEYEKLLATDFQFFFDPDDGLEEFLGASWDRTHEIGAATKMFSNQPGADPKTGDPIPPILSIRFTTFDKLTDWAEPPAEPLYEGTIRARYKVAIQVTYQGEGSYSNVTGDNDFYVEPIEVDGKTLWVIKVWEDKGKDQG